MTSLVDFYELSEINVIVEVNKGNEFVEETLQGVRKRVKIELKMTMLVIFCIRNFCFALQTSAVYLFSSL